jgi:hypothetical protein
LKSFGEILGSLSHNYRTRETPNANPQESQMRNEAHIQEVVPTLIKSPQPKISHNQGLEID